MITPLLVELLSSLFSLVTSEDLTSVISDFLFSIFFLLISLVEFSDTSSDTISSVCCEDEGSTQVLFDSFFGVSFCEAVV